MDSSLKNKLTQYEALPPAGLWDKIVEALEEKENFTERLYHYAPAPPAAVWDKVKQSLDKEPTEAKVIPFSTRFRKSIRYTAAASIIAIALVATTLLLKRTEAGALQAGSHTTVPGQPSVISIPKNNVIVASNNATGVLPAQNDGVAESTLPKKYFFQQLQPKKILAAIISPAGFIPKRAREATIINTRHEDPYMVFSNDAGMVMRLPKKLFPLVQCPDGDGSCGQRVKTLQQKLSASTFTTDFAGVLEMLPQLQ